MVDRGGLHDSCTVLVSSRIALVTAEPYMSELRQRGMAVHLCAPQDVLDDALQRGADLAANAVPLEEFAVGHRRSVRLHALFTTLFASRRLNRSYPLLQDPRRSSHGWKGRLLRFATRLVPKMHPRRFNAVAHRVFSALQRNPFPTDLVVVVSFASMPSLLAARGQTVVTLVESWDHPVKKAAGYVTDLVVGWNDDINRDWCEFQGARDTVLGYPVKLSYALAQTARDTSARQVATDSERGKRAMYAVGTSSNTDRPDWYRDELEVIEALCEATADAGWSLLIKPKPNGRTGDFDHFAAEYAHVEVGLYRDARNALDYYLDDAYNRRRLEELDRCDLVINCWTTFALDAAAAGKPVLQLDLRSVSGWPALRLGLENYHLSTYVVSRSDALRPARESDLSAEVSMLLSDPFPMACAFRDELREWLVSGPNEADAVRAAVSQMVGPSR